MSYEKNADLHISWEKEKSVCKTEHKSAKSQNQDNFIQPWILSGNSIYIIIILKPQFN